MHTNFHYVTLCKKVKLCPQAISLDDSLHSNLSDTILELFSAHNVTVKQTHRPTEDIRAFATLFSAIPFCSAAQSRKFTDQKQEYLMK